MDEHRILVFVFVVIVYTFYSFYSWFYTEEKSDLKVTSTTQEVILEETIDLIVNKTLSDILLPKPVYKKKTIPFFFKNACSILDIFTVKPPKKCDENLKDKDSGNDQLAIFGIFTFLTVLIINAVLDAIKFKEEEKLKQKQNPNEERRQSLAEFANKRPLKRESSKFGLQLFQISECSKSNDEEKNRRSARPYTRGESTNSYLSEKKEKIDIQQVNGSETPTGESSLTKRQSVSKIFAGARPAPMLRRSSFPAIPLHPDIQALRLGSRRPSITDSDDEDGRGRRVRIIRRF